MPDLNSVPPSPHLLATRRRSSQQQMSSPWGSPSSAIHVLPSNQGLVGQGSVAAHSRRHSRSFSQSQRQSQDQSRAASNFSSPQLAASMNWQPQHASTSTESIAGSGSGPLRHPRPLTAVELHAELEKEQEAVVNRLTRELSMLRAAQNASVASNASSTSIAHSMHDPVPDLSLLSGPGFSIPTPRRHHRNSSASQSQHQQPSHEARHLFNRPPAPATPSRQGSVASRRSRANSPGPQISSLDPSSYFHSQRVPPVSSVSMNSVAATPGSGSLAEQTSPGLIPTILRYEETAFYRSELEAAKKENEGLKRRIRDLERMVQRRRASDGRTRSESESTLASAGLTPAAPAAPAAAETVTVPREERAARPGRRRGTTSRSITSVTSVGVGIPEDEVKVGESASSSGLPNNNKKKSNDP